MSDQLSKCQEALQRALQSGHLKSVYHAYTELGLAYFQRCEYTQALQTFEQLLKTATQGTGMVEKVVNKDTEGLQAQGVAYCHMGLICRLMGHLDRALAYHQKHLSVAKLGGNTAAQGMAYSNIGNTYESMGEMEEALVCHTHALAIAEETEDVAGQGIAYANLGSVYDSQGQYRESLHCHQNALAIADSTGDLEAQALACCFIGKAHYSMGNLHKALDYQQRELAIAEQTSSVPAQGRAHRNIGSLCRTLNDFDAALHHYKRALHIAKEEGSENDILYALQGIGCAYYGQGMHSEAINSHQQALDIAENLGDVGAQVTAHGGLGNIYHTLGDFEQALKHHRIACDLLGDDPYGQASALNGMAQACTRLSNHNQALKYYHQALGLCKAIGDTPGQGIACSGCGYASYKQGLYDDAIKHYRQALELAEVTVNLESQESVYASMAHTHYMSGDVYAAQECYWKSLDLAENLGNPAGQTRGHCGLGYCWHVVGNTTKAKDSYRQALTIASNSQAIAAVQDDECISILFSLCERYERRKESPGLQGEDTTSTVVYLWSLIGVLINDTHIRSLDHTSVKIIVHALWDAVGNPTWRDAPYIQYYCIYILYRLSTAQSFIASLIVYEAVDACLACLGIPKIPSGNTDVPSELPDIHSIVVRFMRNLMSPTHGKGEDVRAMVIELSSFSNVLKCVLNLTTPLLPGSSSMPSNSTHPLDVEATKQTNHILNLILMIVEPPERSSFAENVYRDRMKQYRATVDSAHSTPIAQTMCEMLSMLVMSDTFSETDSKFVKLYFRILLDLVKHSQPKKMLIHGINSKAIGAYMVKHVPTTSGLQPLASELIRNLASRSPGRMVPVAMPEVPAHVRSSSRLSSCSDRSSGEGQSNSITDYTDATHYESLSSHSSPTGSPVVVAHLGIGFNNEANI